MSQTGAKEIPRWMLSCLDGNGNLLGFLLQDRCPWVAVCKGCAETCCVLQTPEKHHWGFHPVVPQSVYSDSLSSHFCNGFGCKGKVCTSGGLAGSWTSLCFTALLGAPGKSLGTLGPCQAGFVENAGKIRFCPK